MKTSLSILGLAATAITQFTNRSPDFRLVVLSSTNDTLNGTYLAACHEGAAIEGFCRGPKLTDDPAGYGATFYFNTSSDTNSTTAPGTPGILSYDLVIADNQTIPSAMHLSTDFTTNVAVPILYPGSDSYTVVNFDASDELYIENYQDDTVDPPVYKEEKIKQWYICTTYYSYTYVTLAWVIGKEAKPQNPTCQKVDVKRKYV